MKTALIIDGNNWFRRRAETDIYGNPLRRCYQEIQSSPQDNIVVVWDGKNSLKARRDIYPEYKVKRNKPAEDFFAVQDTFKKLVQLSKAMYVELEGLEGDDIIAHLVNRLKTGGYSNSSILIESNDADLAQLGVPMTRKEFPIEAKWIPLYKTLVGDPSDNIPGLKGFGKKAWESLTDRAKEILLDGLKGNKTDIRIRTNGEKEILIPEETLERLRIYWKIVNFIPVDYHRVDENLHKGYNRPDLAETVLREYMA